MALLDSQPPAALHSELPPHSDPRVSALSPASIELLRSVGAWRALAPAAAPVCDVQARAWGSGWRSGGGRANSLLWSRQAGLAALQPALDGARAALGWPASVPACWATPAMSTELVGAAAG